jgi:hypothetical protein
MRREDPAHDDTSTRRATSNALTPLNPSDDLDLLRLPPGAFFLFMLCLLDSARPKV